MPSSEAEARIRRLMARLQQAENRTRSVEDQIFRTRQNLAGFYQIGVNSRCTTTITGKVVGGDAAATGLAGSTLHVVGHTSGEDYGTFSLPAGTYSLDLQLDPTDTSLDLTATGPGVRFTTGSVITRSIPSQCASNALANIQATPATGYHYLTGSLACQYPIKNTLTAQELQIFGTGVINWVGSWSFLCAPVTSQPGTGCGSAVATAVVLFFADSVSPVLQYPKASLTACPVAATCPSPSGPTVGSMLGAVTLTPAITCPDNSTLFQVVFTGTIPAGNLFYPPGPITVKFFEV
jgi:hypothetical protein